jgi:serine/threonine-protein phosphatase 2A regulatory subunit B''
VLPVQVIQAEPVVRMFDILRKEGCNYVTQADLKSMMAGILLSHPGLEFLQETPEFQDRCCPIALASVGAHM